MEDIGQSEAELVDVDDTQTRDVNHSEGDAQEPCSPAIGNRHEQRRGSIRCSDDGSRGHTHAPSMTFKRR